MKPFKLSVIGTLLAGLCLFSCTEILNESVKDISEGEATQNKRAITDKISCDIVAWDLGSDDSKGWRVNGDHVAQSDANAYGLTASKPLNQLQYSLKPEEIELSKQAQRLRVDFYTDMSKNPNLLTMVSLGGQSSANTKISNLSTLVKKVKINGVDLDQVYYEFDLNPNLMTNGISNICLCYKNGGDQALMAPVFFNKIALVSDVSPQNTIVTIMSKRSGLTIDNSGAKNNGGKVHQWQYYSGLDNQQWTIKRNWSNGTITFISVDSELALDNTGNGYDGAKVHQWQYYSGLDNQQWSLKHVGGGYYHIVSEDSDLALDNGGWSQSTNGGVVKQWTNHLGHINQLWSFQLAR